jgi:RimJ/RimL family protein N-acetyltransferase
MNLLFGHDKAVADFASKQTGAPLRAWHHAVGVIDAAGLLVGAASFHDMNGSNVEICFYGPQCLRASLMHGLAQFAFIGLGAHRVTARTPRKNRMVARHLPRLGFRFEGILRHYYGPTKALDALIFGLLAEDAGRLVGRFQLERAA